MTVWRVSIIYILSLLFVGLLVPFDDQRLVGGSYGPSSVTRNYTIVKVLIVLFILQMPILRHSSSFS